MMVAVTRKLSAAEQRRQDERLLFWREDCARVEASTPQNLPWVPRRQEQSCLFRRGN